MNVHGTYNKGIFFILKSKIPMHAIIWINLANIMLSEISQIQETAITLFHLCVEPRVGKFIDTESSLVASSY